MLRGCKWARLVNQEDSRKFGPERNKEVSPTNGPSETAEPSTEMHTTACERNQPNWMEDYKIF